MKVLAACHIHSNWSYDGKWTISDLAVEFSSRGYQVLMMTEHDRGFSQSRLDEYHEVCRRASSKDILVVPGIEYSDATNTVHVLTWGNIPFIGENVPTGAMLKAVKHVGGVAVLAHPSRRNAWQCFDPTWSEFLMGIEVWNRKTDGWHPSFKAPKLIESSKAVSFVGMDFHTQKQFFPLAMELEVPDSLTEEAVITSLRLRLCEARAFRLPLDHGILKSMLIALKIAESGRRPLAWMYRSLFAAKMRAKLSQQGF